jgi:putative heme degradation protein
MGRKVKTEYVKKEQFDEVWKKLEKRKQLESSLKRLKEDRQLALRVIGK